MHYSHIYMALYCSLSLLYIFNLFFTFIVSFYYLTYQIIVIFNNIYFVKN